MVPNPVINVQQISAAWLGRRCAAGRRLDLGTRHCIDLTDVAG